jgi:hypothetical protein
LKKLTIGLAAVFALILGVTMLGTQTASADVTDIRVVGCELIAGGIDGNDTNAPAAADYDSCDTIANPTSAELLNLDAIYGDDDGELEASDLDEREALADNQIGEDCTTFVAQCTLLVFAFVDDEAPVTLDPPAGLQTLEGGTIDFVCDTEAEDPDCDDTTPNNGDGVVVFHVTNDTADAGDTLTVNVEQETVDASADVNVVGTADDVILTLTPTTIAESGTQSDASDCTTDIDVSDFAEEPNAALAIAEVVDSDGNQLARHTVVFTSGDSDIALIAIGTPGEVVGNSAQTVVAPSTGGIAQYAIICGGTDTGEVEITATYGAIDEEDSATLTVVGGPDAVALTVSPASIACNGTSSATVTATVTDADGNNVANGTNVNFAVVALGTANPINVDTVDGVATSSVVPLSTATQGVTVIVTSGDAQASILVNCSLPDVIATAVATPPTGTISGPDTGNGGYLGQDGSAGFPAWTLVALAIGSVALVGGSLVTKKVSK